MRPNDYSEFISISEAAEEYGTTRTYWYDKVQQGLIRSYELPAKRGTFMKRKDVEAFFQIKEKEYPKPA